MSAADRKEERCRMDDRESEIHDPCQASRIIEANNTRAAVHRPKLGDEIVRVLVPRTGRSQA